MSKKLPVVAIVGQANVGKSSLFNVLVGWKQQVVAREAGTTRDAVYGNVGYGKHHFWLVDTAGLKDPEDEFEATIQEQIEEAVDAADIIVVVVEANSIITDDDRRIAKKALQSKKPVILVTNKADQVSKDDEATQWQRLGVKEIVATCATQRYGMDNLLGTIVEHIPAREALPNDNVLRIALLGRPNVGKSHLFNTLAKKQQAIVANIAGTTRDVNRLRVRFEGRDIELLDTAGIRRSGKIERGIEKFSVLRSLQAIEEADVCLLLMDVNELNTSLDQKIAGIIKEAGKGLIVVVSKWDEAEGKDAFTRDALAPKISYNFKFIPWAPLIFTSAVTGQNVTKLFELAMKIDVNRKRQLRTAELNKVLAQCLQSHPPAGLKNRHPKLRYMVQDDSEPPTFRIYGAHLEFLHWSYKRYLEKHLREIADLSGTPIRMFFMNNERRSGKTTKFLPKKDEPAEEASSL